MRSSVIVLLVLFSFDAFSATACDEEQHIFLGTPRPMPASDAAHDAILCNEGYVVGYSGHYKAPLWVAYRLTESSVTPDSGRSDDFREDTRLVSTARATLPDFKRSGFDRGHMAPRAALDTTPELGSDTFLLSNMTAQAPGFNQGGWRDLEAHILQLAVERDEIFVMTGAVFEGVNRTIGRGNVGVPSHLFKIVWDPEAEEVFSVLIPNEPFDFDEISDFVVDVDEVESWSGIDFLHALPTDEERTLERGEFAVWDVN